MRDIPTGERCVRLNKRSGRSKSGRSKLGRSRVMRRDSLSRPQMLERARGEDGNVMILGLGVGLVALLLVFGLVAVNNVYLEHKRLGYLADGAALVYSDVQTSNAYFERIEDASHVQRTHRDTAEQRASAFVTELGPKLSLRGAGLAGVDREEGGDILTVKFTSRQSAHAATGKKPGSGVEISVAARAENVESQPDQ